MSILDLLKNAPNSEQPIANANGVQAFAQELLLTAKVGTVALNVASDISAYNDMLEIRRRMPELYAHLEGLLKGEGVNNFPLLYDHETSRVVVMDDATWGIPENWFFIGDIHADFFALHTLLNTIKCECPDFRLVFMGDLVDRGEQPAECLFLLMQWAREYPERIIWLAGNHDIAFTWLEEERKFISSVRPSEFLDFLNIDDTMSGFRKLLGDFLIKVTNNLPRAVLFPDGLLASHGGFPLVDKQEAAKALETKESFFDWLNTPECLQDFTWTRITRYPKRQPNRSSKGCSYGFKDFEALCSLKPEWFPAKRLLTGHEHPEFGWEDFPTYLNNPAATICGFGFDYMLDAPAKFHKYKHKLVMGRYQLDSLPQKIEVAYNGEDLAKLYPPAPVEVSESEVIETMTESPELPPVELTVEEVSQANPQSFD